MSLAAKMNFKWSRFVRTDLHKLIPNASAEGIDLIESMLFWEPKKRLTAMQVYIMNIYETSMKPALSRLAFFFFHRIVFAAAVVVVSLLFSSSFKK